MRGIYSEMISSNLRKYEGDTKKKLPDGGTGGGRGGLANAVIDNFQNVYGAVIINNKRY